MLGVGLPFLLSNGKGSMQVNFVTVAGCLDNVEAVWHNVDILHASALGVIQFHTDGTCQLLRVIWRTSASSVSIPVTGFGTLVNL